MKLKMKETMKLHPFSTALLVIYFAASIMQGSIGTFLAGFLAASAAYMLELLFYVTGMIRTGRSCAGRPRSTGSGSSSEIIYEGTFKDPRSTGLRGRQKQRSAA